MDFKLTCVVIIVVGFFLYVLYRSIRGNMSQSKRDLSIENNCKNTLNKVHIYMSTCQYNNSFEQAIMLARRIMGFFDKAYCPLRVYVSIFFEQEHPDYHTVFMKELRRLDSENKKYKMLPRIEVILSNLNFSQPFGTFSSLQQLNDRTQFEQIRNRDFILILNQFSVLYQDWDRTAVREYMLVSEIGMFRACITYIPTVAISYDNIGSSSQTSSLSGDLMKFVKSQSKSGKAHLNEYVPSFTVFTKDSRHDLELVGKSATGRVSRPLEMIGASLDFCFTSKGYINKLFSRIPTKFLVTSPDVVFSMMMHNLGFQFYMPTKSISFMVSGENRELKYDSNQRFNREQTRRFLKRRFRNYGTFAGVRFPGTLSGRACMGVVCDQDAGEIVAKYGSMSGFERVKNYICNK